MILPNTIDPELVLAVKFAMAFLALSVFWPREGYKRRYIARTFTLFFSVFMLAGLEWFDPSELPPIGGGDELSVLAWVACENGAAPWCGNIKDGLLPIEEPEPEAVTPATLVQSEAPS